MKNTTHYSASDIQRYLNGEMSAREMFEIEKASLDDPFLADALEGYEAHPTATADVSELRSRLDTRVTTPGNTQSTNPGAAQSPTPVRRLFTPGLRIAAAIILLIGLGFGAWYLLLNTSRPEQAALVKHKDAPQPQTQTQSPVASQPPVPTQTPATTTTAADSITPSPALADNNFVTTKPAPSLKKAKIPSRSIQDSFKSTYARSAPPAVAAQVRTDSIQYKVQGAAAGRATADLADADKKVSTPPAPAFAFSEFHPRILSGKVLDFNNNPLSGATLHLAGKNDVATVTDVQGNFSMQIDPKTIRDSVLRVNVGMIGYESSSLAFNTLNPEAATGNLIYLKQQANSLNEVVVTGYGSKRRETRAFVSSPSDETIDSLWISAMPVSGRQAYLDYLAKGKTSIGADSTIRGIVVVSFDVNKKGALSSFKVERSLTPAHDAGVIRLVSEGPQWKVSKNRPVRAAVRVTF